MSNSWDSSFLCSHLYITGWWGRAAFNRAWATKMQSLSIGATPFIGLGPLGLYSPVKLKSLVTWLWCESMWLQKIHGKRTKEFDLSEASKPWPLHRGAVGTFRLLLRLHDDGAWAHEFTSNNFIWKNFCIRHEIYHARWYSQPYLPGDGKYLCV